MKRLVPLLLAALLASCQRQPESGGGDLTSRVLFTANGSYDAQADQRGKVADQVGVRRVRWDTRPPLPAQAVTVDYDGEQRTRGWQMTLEQPGFSAAELTGASGKQVTTVEGDATLMVSGPLARVLVLSPTPQSLQLLTRGYAVQHRPQLLPAFDTP
ncbi:hypothetical protein WDJ50_06765 [Deinococcus sp. VB142]|uniref:Uncharacterized protein n=1 Tax=Deinococcus sp. VB142 TaxID=3112952 RepID=A0AAU6Q5C9_9DEIO